MRLLIVAFVQVCYLLVPRRGHWLLRRGIGFYGTSCHGPMLTRPIAFVQVYYLDFHGNAIGFYGEATGFRGEAVEFYGDATAFHGETIGFTERPLISTERSLISTERPLVSTERPLISTERPFLSTERPLFLRGGLFWSYVNEIDCICTSVSSGVVWRSPFWPYADETAFVQVYYLGFYGEAIYKLYKPCLRHLYATSWPRFANDRSLPNMCLSPCRGCPLFRQQDNLYLIRALTYNRNGRHRSQPPICPCCSIV